MGLAQILGAGGVNTGDATAVSVDVLAGKTFYGASGVVATGTMANRGTVTFHAGANNITGNTGYYSGITIAGVTGLSAGNIRNGTTVGGVTGTFPNNGTATAARVWTGDTFYSNNATLRTGTLTPPSAGDIKSNSVIMGVTGTFSNTNSGAEAIHIQTGRVAFVNGNQINGELNPSAANIRQGATIAGVSGTYSYMPAGEIPVGSDLVTGKSAFANGSTTKIVGSLNIPGATAVTGDVISGKTFYAGNTTIKTGNITNRGSATYTPSTSTQSGSAGYYSNITVNPITFNNINNTNTGVFRTANFSIPAKNDMHSSDAAVIAGTNTNFALVNSGHTISSLSSIKFAVLSFQGTDGMALTWSTRSSSTPGSGNERWLRSASTFASGQLFPSLNPLFFILKNDIWNFVGGARQYFRWNADSSDYSLYIELRLVNTNQLWMRFGFALNPGSGSGADTWGSVNAVTLPMWYVYCE